MIGAELGYRYVDSPIICDIPGGPEHLFREYQPTTWPGARLPHVWLDDGTALQDRIGDGYTILNLGGSKADIGGLERVLGPMGRRSRCSRFRIRSRAISMITSSCCCVPTCMWCGAGTRRRRMPPRWRRSPPGIEQTLKGERGRTRAVVPGDRPPGTDGTADWSAGGRAGRFRSVRRKMGTTPASRSGSALALTCRCRTTSPRPASGMRRSTRRSGRKIFESSASSCPGPAHFR